MKAILTVLFGLFLSTQTALGETMKYEPDLSNGADNFYKSDKLNVEKVKFENLYNMKVAGNLFTPKNMDKNVKYPAIIVGHPMGAVKEEASNLYAQKMAERGFITISIDLPYWGESDGEPRNSVLPDIYADAFSSAVDYLGTHPVVDKDKIGVIGICGSGSFAISAAKIDPRLKAIATISMYDMGQASRNALHKSLSLEQRKKIIADAAQLRWQEFEKGNEHDVAGGTITELTENTPPIAREFYDFYRTERGQFIPKGQKSERATKPTITSSVKFMNFYPFEDMDMISPRPLLFITGDQAHSKEFSEDAYKKASEPKELYYVKAAGHVDLYDRTKLIPFDKLEKFFKENLR